MSISFKEMTAKNENELMIVDSLNLSFRYLHSKSLNFAEDYVKVVQSVQKSYHCDKVIITRDGGSSSYRKAILPEYKANRAEKYKDQTELEAKQFQEFLKEYEKAMTMIAELYPVIRFDKVEADDIGAYIVGKRKKYGIKKIQLISTDRDWDLLIAEDVSRWSYASRKDITWDNWHTHYDYPPESHIHIKCLMGDSGDNVPGVDGIGPKRAIELINQYETGFDIVDAIPIPSKYKYIQNLNKCADLILKNYELMDLQTYCAEAIGADNCKELDKILDNYLN